MRINKNLYTNIVKKLLLNVKWQDLGAKRGPVLVFFIRGAESKDINKLHIWADNVKWFLH